MPWGVMGLLWPCDGDRCILTQFIGLCTLHTCSFLLAILNQAALTDKECSISATGFRRQLHPNVRVHPLSSLSMSENELFPLKV